ncbi:MAG TPA: hypothetical protein VFJ02_06295 [Vicinamibacterales bacterium]|nr:hypothetical protein [Vicinamibacterales bacterium]
MSHSRSATSVALTLLLVSCALACGKKGDPLAPLRLVPAPVGELSGRRAAQQIELRFILPKQNANGGGAIDLDRVEIYAATVGPGMVMPPNRDLLTSARVIGTIAVKPPPVEGGPELPPTDKRPSPGDAVTFVEDLTEDKLVPTPGLPAAPPAKPAAATPETVAPPAEPAGATPPSATAKPDVPAQPPVTGAEAKPTGQEAAPAAVPGAAAGAPAAAVPAVVTNPTRIYVVRGLSRSGRPGPPSARLSIPLLSPVAAPTAVAATMPTEKAILIDWTPPVAEPGGAPLTFNVYRRESPTTPINDKPIADFKYEIAGAEYGKEQCYVVRAIQTSQSVTIESDVSAPACLTPLDKFPPATPKNLRAVAEEGAVSLVWDPNGEADLGGYLILRDDGAGGTLQPITPQPIKDASYRDATVTAGLRYTYAIVAVDSATPRNPSAPSTPESVTAR